ncbi:MAG: multifunctional CCA addition/repair protein, partial [Casimicrobiaceae bacterium]
MASRRAREVRTYQVGGAVRDELLGRPVADRDWVVVGATPEMLVASGYRPVGNDFPVFLHPDTHEEHALARTERKHGTGYRGFEFFASPDVTLEEDLARRDLTINAMARAADGSLIDPYHGRDDLARGVLRHVSPAFAEDPLRVLRVARFAARFGFAVAPETAALMREIVASGELPSLSPERIWRELAKGLMEDKPSRMLCVLRECGALAELLPEVDAVFAAGADANANLLAALDYAAAKGWELPVRFATLAQSLHVATGEPMTSARTSAGGRAPVRLADRLSARLRLPLDCRDAAHLAARFRRNVQRAGQLTASQLLALLTACDALRRPQRLTWVVQAAEADACATQSASTPYAPALLLANALQVVRGVDAGAVARESGVRRPQDAASAGA